MTLNHTLHRRLTTSTRWGSTLGSPSGLSHDVVDSPRLTHLALIWPYDPRSGVITGILPLDEAARRSVVAGGYYVVAAVRQQAPYTHVVAVGRQDYLATLVPAAGASPPRVARHGPSAAWRTLRSLAAKAAVDAGTVPSTIDVEMQDAGRQEQAWESEGGALAGGSHVGVAVDASPPPLPGQLVDAGVDLGGDRPMTGTITDLRPGGFGFIASESYGKPWQLSFRRSAFADGFIDLHIGQRVRFDQKLIPGGGRRQHAVGIVPLD